MGGHSQKLPTPPPVEGDTPLLASDVPGRETVGDPPNTIGATPTDTTAPCPAPHEIDVLPATVVAAASSPLSAHPHGWFGYIVEDKERTANCVRLLRWLAIGTVAPLAVLAVVLWLLLQSPVVAAAIGGVSAATAGGAAWSSWRRTRGRRGTPPRRRSS
jgi:hypothetical protein